MCVAIPGPHFSRARPRFSGRRLAELRVAGNHKGGTACLAPFEPYHVAWHNGAWVGTQALAFRRDDGVVAVVIYNGTPVDLVGPIELIEMSDRLAFPDEGWPADDLFPWVMTCWPACE